MECYYDRENTETSISCLPNSVLAQILDYLEPSEWITVEGVNRRWKQAVFSLWRSIVRIDFVAPSAIRIVDALGTRKIFAFPENCDWADTTHLAFLMERCGKRLLSLQLHMDESIIQPCDISFVAQYCKKLIRLDVKGDIPSIKVQLLNFLALRKDTLEELYLEDTVGPTCDLDFNEVRAIEFSEIVESALFVCSKLKGLWLSSVCLNAPLKSSLRALRHLEFLSHFSCLAWCPRSTQSIDYISDLLLNVATSPSKDFECLTLHLEVGGPVSLDQQESLAENLSFLGQQKSTRSFFISLPYRETSGSQIENLPRELCLEIHKALELHYNAVTNLTLWYISLKHISAQKALSKLGCHLKFLSFAYNDGLDDEFLEKVTGLFPVLEGIGLRGIMVTNVYLEGFILGSQELGSVTLMTVMGLQYIDLIRGLQEKFNQLNAWRTVLELVVTYKNCNVDALTTEINQQRLEGVTTLKRRGKLVVSICGSRLRRMLRALP